MHSLLVASIRGVNYTDAGGQKHLWATGKCSLRCIACWARVANLILYCCLVMVIKTTANMAAFWQGPEKRIGLQSSEPPNRKHNSWPHGDPHVVLCAAASRLGWERVSQPVTDGHGVKSNIQYTGVDQPHAQPLSINGEGSFALSGFCWSPLERLPRIGRRRTSYFSPDAP